MSYLTPDKLSPAELVAEVLGKKAIDAECHRIALAIEEGSDDFLLAEVAREPAAAKRASRISSAIELGKRSMTARAINNSDTITTPEQVLALMAPRYSGLEKEKFYCLCLNTRNRLKKIVEVSVGSLNASIVHPRELFQEAVRCSAAAIIITHNHPSGDTAPSGADLQLTRRLTKAGEVLGIEVLDHVIIGGGAFLSMRESGVL